MLLHALCAALLAAGQGAEEAKPTPILVLPPTLQGAAPGWGPPLADAIASAVAQDRRFDVVSSDDLQAFGAHLTDRQLAGCDADEACLTRLAELGAARFVLSSTVGAVGDEVVVSLALVDTKNPLDARRTTFTARAMPDAVAQLNGAVISLLGAPSAPAAKEAPSGNKGFSCAVLDLKASGIDQHLADNLTQVLSTEIRTVEGSRVVSRDDIVAMLTASGEAQMMGCDDMACMAEIGGALGVDKLVVGSVGHVGTSYVVSLRLIDTRAVHVENRVTESYTGAENQLIGAVRAAARQLLGITRNEPGQLIMSVSEAGAEVFVDGKPVGVTPMEPLLGLTPGRHAVRVTRDGFYDYNGELYVGPADTTGGWVRLEEIPEAWYEKWWVWTLIGSAAVGAVVTGVVLGTQNQGAIQVQAEVPGGWR